MRGLPFIRPFNKYGHSLDSPCRVSAIVLIMLTLVTSAVFVALRCYFSEPVSDDLLYRFILDDNPLGNNEYSAFVTGWGDALQSQSVQYFHSNGRFIVHVLVQMFAGPWGHVAFSVFTGCLIFVVMSLIGLYCVRGRLKCNPLIWLGIAIAYLYLFQSDSRMWYLIVGCMNYLYPMFCVLLFLILFRHFGNMEHRPSPLVLILLGAAGFITGWSQECYSLPLSGGVFLSLISARFRRERVSGACLILALTLWAGTCILIFAPGNFVRLRESSGLILTALNGLRLLAGTKLFWIMLAGLVAFRLYDKTVYKAFVNDNAMVLMTLVIALCFGMIANTLPQSFNGIAFYSCILIFSMAGYIPAAGNKKALNIASAGLLCLLVWHQARIVEGCIQVRDINKQFVHNYIASTDGVVEIPEIHLPGDVAPFVNNWFTSEVRWWLMFTIEQYYTKGEKPIILLDKEGHKLNASANR